MENTRKEKILYFSHHNHFHFAILFFLEIQNTIDSFGIRFWGGLGIHYPTPSKIHAWWNSIISCENHYYFFILLSFMVNQFHCLLKKFQYFWRILLFFIFLLNNFILCLLLLLKLFSNYASFLVILKMWNKQRFYQQRKSYLKHVS